MILEQYFVFANQKGGIALRAKLAMKTCITSSLAPTLPDVPEHLQRMKMALQELLPGEKIPEFGKTA